MASLRHLLVTAFILFLSLSAHAASSTELNATVHEALKNLYAQSSAAKSLGSRAKGILVFPKVLKGGLVVGGEYGEGALLKNGAIQDYYNTVSASIGFQLGAQARSQIVMFMTSEALNNFVNSEGWEAGIDGSIAIAEFGAGEGIDTKTARAPIIGFISNNKGLMYNLTLEGSKITKIEK
ncbi:BPSL1445 family SYLF domain-containing lipoprotein [Endozoicomonas sp. 2B-B]